MKFKTQYFFILSFVLGVAYQSVFDFSNSFLGLVLVLSLFSFFIYLFRKNRLVFLISIILFSFFLGAFRLDIDRENHGSILLDKELGKEVSIEGIIIDEPDAREKVTLLRIKIDSYGGIDIGQNVKLITIASKYPEFNYGDKVEVVGVLKKPENFTGDNNKEFDYINYLAKSNIFYSISFPELSLVSENNGNLVKSVLFSVKQGFISKLNELLPDPHVSLLGGLVVGAKQSLGDELEDDFRKTGIIHIVVLSGYNVTIVAEAIMRTLSFLPMALTTSIGGISIIFFAIMTGASATIVRASIMALLVIVARATGRTYQVTHGLFLAGFFMVLHNPMIVIYDPSFQLSFLATLGLIYLAPLIEKYFKLIPTKWQLREFAVATIATQIFVLPLILYMMGEISLVALPVNLLILIFIPITMLFGFLSGIVGFMSATLAFPLTFITYLLLEYELKVVEIFSNFPFASLQIPNFPLWLMFGIYTLYIYIMFRMYKNKKTG